VTRCRENQQWLRHDCGTANESPVADRLVARSIRNAASAHGIIQPPYIFLSQEDPRLVPRVLDTVERFWNASTLVGALEGAGNFKIPCAVNEYLLAVVGRPARPYIGRMERSLESESVSGTETCCVLVSFPCGNPEIRSRSTERNPAIPSSLRPPSAVPSLIRGENGKGEGDSPPAALRSSV
jgi:hypothetical protein